MSDLKERFAHLQSTGAGWLPLGNAIGVEGT